MIVCKTSSTTRNKRSRQRQQQRLAYHNTMTSATTTLIGKTTARALAAVAVGSSGSFLWVHHYHNNNKNDNQGRVDDHDKIEDDNGARMLLSTWLSSSLQLPSPLKSQSKFTTLFSFSNLTTTRSACDSSTKAAGVGAGAGAVDPSFPDLSRFGSHSYLKRYLTPDVYAQLKDKTTSNGVTLEDLIQSGVTLPWGARPPRGTGVYAGDAESYEVFADILVPVLEDYHHFRRVQRNEDDQMVGKSPGRRRRGSMLRRQFTNMNPSYVLRQQLDPTGDYILQTRMRVARSIKGFPFSPVLSRADRRALERLFCECVESDEWTADPELNGKYLPVMDMSNEQHDDLIQKHILFHDPDEYNISAGIGRDWPDARGIYLNTSSDAGPDNDKTTNTSAQQPDLIIWVNKEDHLRIIATANGGDLLAVFKRLTKALSLLETLLQKRGHGFCTHPQYGFLNTSPENLGTALRASVFVKLYRLGQQPGFDELLDRLRLEASSRFKDDKKSRYTGIFDIANAERLGQSEVQLINTMINGVGRLIDLEKRLERGEKVDLDEIR